MIFPTGSTFIFGSWIYEADNNGKLQGHLLKDPDHHKEFHISPTTTDQLTRRFAQLTVSDSNQISRPLVSDSNSNIKAKFYPSAFKKPSSFLARFRSTSQNNSDYPQSSSNKSSSFLFGLDNMAKSYQGQFERSFNPRCGIPLTGAQEGLVLTITSQDCIIHWPGSVPEDSSTQLVGTTTTAILPYQEGDSIYDTEASTKVISNSDSMKANANNRATHAREVLMVRRPRSPLNLPEAPDVRSSDESESNISPFAQGYDGETESQKQARERKNKLKQGRQHHAGSAGKPGSDMSQSWPNTIEENHNEKSKKDARQVRPTIRSEKH